MKWRTLCTRICDGCFFLFTFFAAFAFQVVAMVDYVEGYDLWPYQRINHSVIQNYLWAIIVTCLLFCLYQFISRLIGPSRPKGLWTVRIIFYVLLTLSLPWLINSYWMQLLLNVLLLLVLLVCPHRDKILFAVVMFAAVVNLWIIGVIVIGGRISVENVLYAIFGLTGPLLFILLLIFCYLRRCQAVRLICLSVLAIKLLAGMLLWQTGGHATNPIPRSAFLAIPIITCLTGWLLQRKGQSQGRLKKITMLSSILVLFLLYGSAMLHYWILYHNVMQMSYRVVGTTGFVRLCLTNWSIVPSLVMCWMGSMLLSMFFARVPFRRRYQKVLAHLAVTVYTLAFIPIMVFYRDGAFVWHPALSVTAAFILPALGNLMLCFRSVRVGVGVLSGGLLLWGLIICLVNYHQGARAYDFVAACMLIPAVLLLRGLLCPNSRIASAAGTIVCCWSVYIVCIEYLGFLSRSLERLDLLAALYIVSMFAAVFSLVCLIIDTVMVFRSRRKAAVPAAPGGEAE